MFKALTPTDLENVRQRFYDEGISVVDWSRRYGFDAHLVYSVLSGRSRATRGESHRIAIALGLKTARAPSLLREGKDKMSPSEGVP